MHRIQVFEYERLTTHKDEFNRYITPVQFEKLCQFNDNNDHKYFTIIRNGVKFANYVGVIQIGNLVIEILPKADKTVLNRNNEKESFNTWQKVLLKMLAVSGYLKIDSVSQSFLKKRHNSLLDLYYEIYLNELEGLLRNGLVKKYRQVSSNLKALKGSIHFARHIRQNLVHQERIYTRHQQYDYEHLVNQILLKGLRVLRQLSHNESIISRINKLCFHFPDIKEIPVNKSSFDKVNLNRKTETYSEAINIARMLILNYSPDISRGQDDMLAILFDMNLLWEKYIYKRLKQGESGRYRVNYQEGKRFWNHRLIRPDLVIRKDKETIILDTKWRLAEANNPSDDELKQMYAYNMYWDARKAILLYPKTGEKKEEDFGKFYKGINGEHLCKVGFVDVLDENGELNMGVAEDILEKIN